MIASLDSAPFRHVSVVDDSPLQAAHLADLCRQLGIPRITQHLGGREALWHAFADPAAPDAMIIDLEMPDMDGISLLHAMVEHDLLGNTAVVIASARESSLLRSVECLCRTQGIHLLDVLPKPVSLATLQQTLNRRPARIAAPPPVPTIAFSLRDLLEGLREHQFIPWFQPKVTLESAALAGVEALMRWQHPAHGMVPPGQFITLLEQSALIAPATLELIEQTLIGQRAWHAAGLSVPVSVNLSAPLLGDGVFIDEMLRLLRLHSADPARLIFEVTETAIMTDLEKSIANLARLRMKGFGLSIDDFGTGFASMRQLSQVPFTELKIDRSLVHDSHRQPQLRVVLESIIGLSRKLRLKLVAEGIENVNDWRVLRNLRCEMAQGFLVARPMPANRLVAWAAGNHDPLSSFQPLADGLSAGASP